MAHRTQQPWLSHHAGGNTHWPGVHGRIHSGAQFSEPGRHWSPHSMRFNRLGCLNLAHEKGARGFLHRCHRDRRGCPWNQRSADHLGLLRLEALKQSHGPAAIIIRFSRDGIRAAAPYGPNRSDWGLTFGIRFGDGSAALTGGSPGPEFIGLSARSRCSPRPFGPQTSIPANAPGLCSAESLVPV